VATKKSNCGIDRWRRHFGSGCGSGRRTTVLTVFRGGRLIIAMPELISPHPTLRTQATCVRHLARTAAWCLFFAVNVVTRRASGAEAPQFAFASVDEGRRILTTRDDFATRMSGFDRAARVKTDREISESTFLEFVGTNVMAWDNAEKERISAALNELRPVLSQYVHKLPGSVLLIKTTGREEGNAQYTRGNAIVLDQKTVAQTEAKTLKATLAHEFFHVLSRLDPPLRERCYAAIGFHKCAETALPSSLGLPRVTNPDAPINNHYIVVKVSGVSMGAIPMIYSRSTAYDVQKGGEFLNYIDFKFLVAPISSGAAAPDFSGKNARLAAMDELTRFFEQIGNNTQYIIHPEEIMADNFALLMTGGTVHSPEIQKKLQEALAGE
jgi:hypothetical protein